jgi:L-lactate dehydrogenase
MASHVALTLTSKVAIIGAGSVGAAIVFSLLHRQLVGEVYLVDVDQKLCHAQVQDLSDAASLTDTKLRVASSKEAGQCDIIVMTAGVHQEPQETRLDLLNRNLKILKSVIAAMQPLREEAILIIVTNPVDILTSVARSISGLPPHQVIGSGTFLDTLRLRLILGRKLQVRDESMWTRCPVSYWNYRLQKLRFTHTLLASMATLKW